MRIDRQDTNLWAIILEDKEVGDLVAGYAHRLEDGTITYEVYDCFSEPVSIIEAAKRKWKELSDLQDSITRKE